MPTILCAAALLVALVSMAAHPMALAWGDDSVVQAEHPPGAWDRVEPRSERDVEMLRRLLELTLQPAPAGSNTPAVPATGSETSPSSSESAAPRTSATGTVGLPQARAGLG